MGFFGRLAEIVSEHLRKGSSIYVEGRIRTRKWQAQDGTDRYSTEIVAEQMQMLGGRGSGGSDNDDHQRSSRSHDNQRGTTGGRNGGGSGNGRSSTRPATGTAPGGGGYSEEDDDIPFAGNASYSDFLRITNEI